MKNKPTDIPEDMEMWTPLLKLIDHKTGEEIIANDDDELPAQYNTPEIKHFYKCMGKAESFFEREGDYEITEIRLFTNVDKPYWTYKRIQPFDNNRFGKMRKALEDYSGIKSKVRPLKPSSDRFL